MHRIAKLSVVVLSSVFSLSVFATTESTTGLKPGEKPVSEIIKNIDVKPIDEATRKKIAQQKANSDSSTQTTPKVNTSGNDDLNPGLNPKAVGENASDDAIPITTKSEDPKNGFGLNTRAGFSTYNYLSKLKNCEATSIEAGADSVTIKGYKKGRCHVIYSIAGRKVNCMFTQKQLNQLASDKKLEQANDYDRGVGMILRPLGTDDPSSPLATCQQ